MENRAHALAAGMFVLAVGAMLVALAFWLTRDTASRRSFELSTREAVTGLQPQAAVRFRGVAVGKVSAIGFDKAVPGNVLVRLTLDDSVPITSATYATLGYQGVTGLAFVQLDDDASIAPKPLDSTGDPLARIPLRPGLLAILSQRGTNILQQLETSSERVNQLLHPDNQKALMAAIGTLDQAAGSIARFATKADQLMEGPVGTKVPALVHEAKSTLVALQGTAVQVSASVNEVKDSAREFRRMSERMTEAGGTLETMGDSAAVLAATGRAFRATTVPKMNRTADEAARASRQAGLVFEHLNANPQALIFGGAAAAPGPGEPGFIAPGVK